MKNGCVNQLFLLELSKWAARKNVTTPRPLTVIPVSSSIAFKMFMFRKSRKPGGLGLIILISKSD